jgi:hypothetical protein
VYIPDFSNHCYFAKGERLRSVGWLENSHSFELGEVPKDLLPLLREHLQAPFGIIDFCGSHRCSLCDCNSAPEGNGELIVPSDDVCYVAPVLLAHYVEAHGYKPPSKFIDALRKCPPQRSELYMERISQFLSELSNAV